MSGLIQRVNVRELPKGAPKIIAIFSFRYDAHLVPDLIANITPIVHGYACWDDRGDHGHHSNEPARRNALNAAAIDMGADWILGIDPDERLEIRAASRIPELTKDRTAHTALGFHLREMVRSDAWRCDGVWGQKSQVRLYPAHAVQKPLSKILHGEWFNATHEYKVRKTGLHLYHLRHVARSRELARRDAYAAADPERRFNSVGYDYLTDERSIKIQVISDGRRFEPPHVDDGQLWGPEKVYDQLTADPDRCLFKLAERSLLLNGGGAALVALQDLSKRHPGDRDLTVIADMLKLSETAESAGSASTDGWRRWFEGPFTHREGSQNGRGPLVAIVMSYKAQKTTRDAVAALRAQSQDLEIVVVNSGGGEMEKVIGDQIEQVRLIDVVKPLRVGAIRNIGIDASFAPYVSFLAADCIPLPGWVSGRIAHHKAGALSVSSAVLPNKPDTMAGELVQTLRLASRRPDIGSDEATHYGRSYRRNVFSLCGYFAPRLQVGEDTEFHQRLDRIETPIWAPEVAIRHRDPPSVLAFLLDARRRAKIDAFSTFNFSRADGHIESRLRFYRERIAERRAGAHGGLFRQKALALFEDLFVWINRRTLVRAAPVVQRADVFRVTSRLSLGLGRFDEALLAASRAVKLDPNNVDIHVRLGLAWLAKDEQIEACSAFLCAVELKPSEGDLIVLTIKALLKANREDLAARVLARAILIAPLQASLQSIAAELARAAGNLDAAMIHATRALLLRPATAAAHEALAEIHEAMGDDEQAKLRRRSAAELT